MPFRGLYKMATEKIIWVWGLASPLLLDPLQKEHRKGHNRVQHSLIQLHAKFHNNPSSSKRVRANLLTRPSSENEHEGEERQPPIWGLASPLLLDPLQKQLCKGHNRIQHSILQLDAKFYNNPSSRKRVRANLLTK